MRNGKSPGLSRRRALDRLAGLNRPVGRYRVRVTEDPDGPGQRIWWMDTILARSAAEAVLIGKLRVTLEAYHHRGGDDTAGWGLMAVPEAWWLLGAGAADNQLRALLERGDLPAEAPVRVTAGSAWDEAVEGA
jgi:hypothetical protein